MFIIVNFCLTRGPLVKGRSLGTASLGFCILLFSRSTFCDSINNYRKSQKRFKWEAVLLLDVSISPKLMCHNSKQIYRGKNILLIPFLTKKVLCSIKNKVLERPNDGFCNLKSVWSAVFIQSQLLIDMSVLRLINLNGQMFQD